MSFGTKSENGSSAWEAVCSGHEAALQAIPEASGALEANRQAWQHLIDYRLINWGSHPNQLADVGVDPPSRETIDRAISLAKRFQERGFPPPDSVVPDANGGIVFERREQDIAEVLYVWDDGTAEYQRFQGTELVERSPL
jgi:hypothetical protein